MKEKLLTVQEAADICGISEHIILSYINNDMLLVAEFNGQYLLNKFSMSKLEAILDKVLNEELASHSNANQEGVDFESSKHSELDPITDSFLDNLFSSKSNSNQNPEDYGFLPSDISKVKLINEEIFAELVIHQDQTGSCVAEKLYSSIIDISEDSLLLLEKVFKSFQGF